MSAPGFWEIATLVVLALLIFGPEKLPSLARSAGKTIAQFKREAQSTMDEFKRAADLQEMQEAGRELRDAAKEIEAQADLTGPVASDDGAVERPQERATAVLPPPFDPDAT